MNVRPRLVAALSLLAPALAFGGDEALGTLTVKGKTAVLRYTYVTREPDPADTGREYIVFLLSDTKLAVDDRRPSRLQALAQQRRLRALKVRWGYGYDDVSCVPYHADVEESGQVRRGVMILDLRALDDRQVKAHVRSKMLGQDWHFSARLEARIREGRAVEAEMEAPADAVPPEAEVSEDVVPAGQGGEDAMAWKRELGRMRLEATPEGFDYAVRDGNVAAVRLFLKLGMNPNATDFRGDHMMLTAATFCARAPHEARGEVVLALLAGGADVHGGKPPAQALTLIWAAEHCPPQVVAAMIEAGADVNARAPGSATPLMMAGFRQDAGGPEVVALLKKAGARE